VSRLVWLKVRFSMTVLRVELSYLFCLLGLRYVTVTALILRLEEMNAQLGSIAAAQMA
jgi:hypothetical protein